MICETGAKMTEEIHPILAKEIHLTLASCLLCSAGIPKVLLVKKETTANYPTREEVLPCGLILLSA